MSNVTLKVFVGHRFTQSYMDDFREAINAALNTTNLPLEPVYADLTLVNGHILKDKIQPMIDSALLCIFDITEQDKPNVFIELGYAFGKGKHVVLTSGKPLPTDLGGYDAIIYVSLKELKEKLIKYLPGIAGQAAFRTYPIVGVYPKEFLQIVVGNYESGKVTKKSELYKDFNHKDIDGFIKFFVKEGHLKDNDDSIALTSDGVSLFKSLLKK